MSPLAILTRHFQRKVRREEPPLPDRASLAAALAQVESHAGLHALLALVVERNIQFEPFDFIMTPQELIRDGHRWTLDGGAVGPDDVPFARNRAGGLYVFDATSRRCAPRSTR